MDTRIATAIFIVVAVILAIVAGVSIADESYVLLVVILLSAAGALFLLYPYALTFGCVVLIYSGISLPQFADKLNAFHIAAAFLLGATTIRALMHKTPKIPWSSGHTWLMIFAGVIVITMVVRGAGLRALGDSKWGGMFYIQLLLTLSLIFTIPRLNLPAPWWRFVLAISLLVTFLPAFSEVAYILTGGKTEAIFAFIRPNSQIMQSMQVAEAGGDSGVVRFTSMSVAGYSLLVLVLLYVPIKRLVSWQAGLMVIPCAVAFVLAGFGGYRSQMLVMVMLIVILMIWKKCLDFQRVVIAFLFFAILYAVALVAGRDLPSSMQRMVSILPGVEVDGAVAADAQGTIDWRLELWQKGIKKIPDYWLVGKGYAFSGDEMMTVKAMGLSADATDWAVVTSAYHQGLISLIVGLGVPGLIAGLAIFITFIRRHLKFQREAWDDPRVYLCHQVFTAILIMAFIRYCFVYGDVQASYPDVFYYIAILEGLATAGCRSAMPQLRGLRQQAEKRDLQVHYA